MESITIEQIKEAKEKMAQEILCSMKVFQQTTSMDIACIEIASDLENINIKIHLTL